MAIAAIIPPELTQAWGNSEHCIALVEQAALILGIIRFRIIRGRSLLWFEDNSAGLSGLVKGTSGHPMLDAGAATIHLLLSALEARAWFEYVESDSNWSDGASRLLTADPWAKVAGFALNLRDVPMYMAMVGAGQPSHKIRRAGAREQIGATVAKAGTTVG